VIDVPASFVLAAVGFVAFALHSYVVTSYQRE
jgi:hypothetical protein